MKRAVIVLGHGSRRKEANEEIGQLVEMLAQRQENLMICAAYAEFAKPDLEEAVAYLASQGVENVQIMPLFLTVGNHLSQKLPEKVTYLQGKYQGLTITMLKHIGADPLIVEMIENRLADA